MDEMSGGPSPSAAKLKQRFKEAWRLFKAGDNDAAEAMAIELLFEPHLGSKHKAGCHVILTTSSDNSFEHGIKTLQRYNDLLERNILTGAEENCIVADFRDGMKRVDKARQDKARIDQQIREKHAGGMAMEEPSQSVPEMTGDSQLSSQHTIGTNLDDNELLPEIVKYKVGSGLKKDKGLMEG